MNQGEEGFRLRRGQLVEHMKATGSLQTLEVENAFLRVKREIFFPRSAAQYAYADDAFPIGFNQTISQPSTIAVMLEMLELGEGMNVLEVGSGCGYVLALLSELVGAGGKVFGTEIIRELAEQSRKNLELQGCKNVEVFEADGSAGLQEKAPFERLIVSAACPFIPKPLFEQVVEGGVIVAPVGDSFSQQMLSMRKFKGRPFKKEYAGGMFRFVPLRGEHAKRHFKWWP